MALLAILLLAGCELESLDCPTTVQADGTVIVTAPYNWEGLDDDPLNDPPLNDIRGTVYLAIQVPTIWSPTAAEFSATSDGGAVSNNGPVTPSAINPTYPLPMLDGLPPFQDSETCFDDDASPPGTTFYTIGPLDPDLPDDSDPLNYILPNDTGSLTAAFDLNGNGGATGPTDIIVSIAFRGSADTLPEVFRRQRCGNTLQCTVTVERPVSVPVAIPTLGNYGLMLLIIGLGVVLQLGARKYKTVKPNTRF
ncbi:MAG: hypothetical protein ABW201_11005 [Candidatus Thiodiazotropha sp.]